YINAGLALLLMAVTLSAAVLTVAEVVGARANVAALRWASAFGLVASAFFLLHAGIRIGSSGPLLHMASQRAEWGEIAYLAAQVTGQALTIGGIVGLCLWAVGLSLIGLRTKVFPLALCALGVFPALRLVTGTMGPLGILPDSELLWVFSIAAIPGTMLWCFVLGLVLLRRSIRSTSQPRLDPASAVAA
ncbi:MAG: hypothetical protein ABIP53_04830, partial [Candidatus Limnocylindrales bacterium]